MRENIRAKTQSRKGNTLCALASLREFSLNRLIATHRISHKKFFSPAFSRFSCFKALYQRTAAICRLTASGF